ncbi:MAG: release factor glutamine methyltransferase [Planctomycetota bacterium]|jgi:release factor glutamine methyltransferase
MSENIDTAVHWASDQISSISESARLDAELLLAHCLDKPRSFLYSWPEKVLSEESWQQYRALVARRLLPTPIAYILGSREFYSMEFTTNAAVLVPRPETELLVEQLLHHCPVDLPCKILELGTGSGIIAITLKHQRPLATVLATDIDPACLAVARGNATRHQLEVEFVESNWFENIEPHVHYDLIVSNPPYIAADHPFLEQGDLPAEPDIALSPGKTGMEALEILISQAPRYLLPGGWLLLEHGYDQQELVAELLKEQQFDQIKCEYDDNDLPRVSIGRFGKL